MKILAIYERPPIPTRELDYIAYDEDSYSGEPSDHMGTGPTKEDAIRELAEQSFEDYSDEELTAAHNHAKQIGDTNTMEFIGRIRELLAL